MDELGVIFSSLPDKPQPKYLIWMAVSEEERRHLGARRNGSKRKQPPILGLKWKDRKAKQMQQNPTGAERILREGLKAAGIMFDNQRVLLGYIADFYLPRYKLLIEVDGSVHKNMKESDEFRDGVFHTNGFHVLRFSNKIVASDLPSVIAEIQRECDKIGNIGNEAWRTGRVAPFIARPPMAPRKGKYKWGQGPVRKQRTWKSK